MGGIGSVIGLLLEKRMNIKVTSISILKLKNLADRLCLKIFRQFSKSLAYKISCFPPFPPGFPPPPGVSLPRGQPSLRVPRLRAPQAQVLRQERRDTAQGARHCGVAQVTAFGI